MTVLRVLRAGPGVTVQDMGRNGKLALGLSRGGAADRLALVEGAALLGQSAELAALEMAALGGEFEADHDIRIALTGAPMRATIDGEPVAWNASHLLLAGARLSIGAVTRGCYGYLHVGGGIAGEQVLGACSAHLAAGIGTAITSGDVLSVGPDRGGDTGLFLDQDDRFGGGLVRLVASFQTHLFAPQEIARLQSEPLVRAARANRMGVALMPAGGGIEVTGGRSVVSEVVMPGDIQITGDGTPFVLMAECQTTGGYPRIGSVLPCDLPRVAQTPAGGELWFQFVELASAVEIERADAKQRAGLDMQRKPLIRDPHRIRDLLSYTLISGAITGFEED